MDNLKAKFQRMEAAICRLPNGRGKLQFRVGDPSITIYTINDGATYGDLTNVLIPNDGDSQVIINHCCSVVGSAKVFMDGVRVPENVSDVGSVTIQYTNKSIIITKDPAFTNISLYQIEYEHFY